MPRKPSDITHGVTVTVRLSPKNHLTYLKLGSTKWLRRYLESAQGREDDFKKLLEIKNADCIRSDR